MAPYGLTTDWPETSQGRYLGYKSVVQGVYIQPTFAVKINDKFSVGFGIDVTYLNVELRQRVDSRPRRQLPERPRRSSAVGVPDPYTDFADVQLKGHAWNVGYHLGMIVKPHERFAIGARYLSGQSVDVERRHDRHHPDHDRPEAAAAAGRRRPIDALVAPAVRVRRQAERPVGRPPRCRCPRSSWSA